MLEDFPEANGAKNEAGVYSLINDEVRIKFTSFAGARINVSNLQESVMYYKKIGLVLADPVNDGLTEDRVYMGSDDYEHFTLVLTQADKIDRGNASGCM